MSAEYVIQTVYRGNFKVTVEELVAAGMYCEDAALAELRADILLDFLTLYGIDKYEGYKSTPRGTSDWLGDTCFVRASPNEPWKRVALDTIKT